MKPKLCRAAWCPKLATNRHGYCREHRPSSPCRFRGCPKTPAAQAKHGVCNDHRSWWGACASCQSVTWKGARLCASCAGLKTPTRTGRACAVQGCGTPLSARRVSDYCPAHRDLCPRRAAYMDVWLATPEGRQSVRAAHRKHNQKRKAR
jgi:hypothetical protein